MVRIYVFVRPGNAGDNQTNTNAQNAWLSLSEHPNGEYIYIIEDNPENQTFISQFQVTEFPTIVFVNAEQDGTGTTISRIVGQASELQIYRSYLAALENTNTLPGQQGGVSVIEGDGAGGGALGLKLPWGIILLIAGIYLSNKK